MQSAISTDASEVIQPLDSEDDPQSLDAEDGPLINFVRCLQPRFQGFFLLPYL